MINIYASESMQMSANCLVALHWLTLRYYKFNWIVYFLQLRSYVYIIAGCEPGCRFFGSFALKVILLETQGWGPVIPQWISWWCKVVDWSGLSCACKRYYLILILFRAWKFPETEHALLEQVHINMSALIFCYPLRCNTLICTGHFWNHLQCPKYLRTYYHHR